MVDPAVVTIQARPDVSDEHFESSSKVGSKALYYNTEDLKAKIHDVE